jgi:hypothetical protein
MELELYDFFETENFRLERHVGSPEQILSELKKKCDRLSERPRTYEIGEWSRMIREYLILPQYWRNFLSEMNSSLDSALSTILSLEFGNPDSPSVHIHHIKTQTKTINSNDLLAIEFGQGDIVKGKQELEYLRNLGLLIFT